MASDHLSNEDLLILEKAAHQLDAVASMYNQVRHKGFAVGFENYEKAEAEATKSSLAIRQLVGKYFLNKQAEKMLRS